MKRILPPILVIILFISVACQEHYAIEDRAKKQLMVSLEDELESFSPGKSDWYIEGLKTVYANDTICLLQCTARFQDAQGEKKVRDYRYIYLIDTEMSRILGRRVFKEEFRNILCLPDNLIKKSRKDVRKNNESVYDQSFGRTITVRRPYDNS